MRDIERQYGAFPSKNQIRQYLRCRREYVNVLMEGRSKRYWAGDVAERLVKR